MCKKAKTCSLICPGTGLALVGKNRLATAVFLASISVFPALILLALVPGPFALAILAASLLLALWAHFRERYGIADAELSEFGPVEQGWLARHFWKAAIASWVVALATLVFFVMSLGSMLMVGNGMSPTLVSRERLIFRKSVVPERLNRGRVVAFRVTSRSAWGKSGDIVVARILAVPGDRLSMDLNKYFVNGRVAAETGPLIRRRPVIDVPERPKKLVVQGGTYFVIQDSPQNGYDSRVLSWVETHDLVSTELYYLSSHGLLTPVR